MNCSTLEGKTYTNKIKLFTPYVVADNFNDKERFEIGIYTHPESK